MVDLVEKLHKLGFVSSECALNALRVVDRRNFVLIRDRAYLPSPLSIGYNVTISSPQLVRPLATRDTHE